MIFKRYSLCLQMGWSHSAISLGKALLELLFLVSVETD
jgi:hypothetical protein